MVLRIRMFGQRQAIGILGIIFAIAGGIAWFFQQTIFAVMLWSVAGIILLKLNRKSRIRSKR
jgi:4-hydroxybenzoate polyprenyltransferase